ncbi:MAG: UDP-3-O-acyl-N-acetylglucosamine deacetylase [Alphaproteobacteria bacterium]|nr:UDP-3-O-acyl-N-acetylglucosamine deacetylase [Alphaproteobacteria bacterium]
MLRDLPSAQIGARAAANPIRQKTLKSGIHCSGIGLHSGAKISMALQPADCNTGITFRRTDVAAAASDIHALYSNVCDTRLCTTLTNEHGVSVATVEHLLAAMAGCEIDNAVVELDGSEVPIMDGSSEPFVFLIECAGIVEQDAPRQAIEILKPVTARIGDAVAMIEPSPTFSIQLGIAFDNPLIGEQEFDIHVTSDNFKSDICRARTFGFIEDVQALRKAGLVQGGSLDNAIVVSGDEILNDGGLRYDDEFIRHKVLDCIGDLYLAGGLLIGQFTGHRAGHQVNNLLLRTLFADKEAWSCVPMEDRFDLPAQEWNEPAAAVA